MATSTPPSGSPRLLRPTRRDVVIAGLLTAIGAASVGLKPVSAAPVLTPGRIDHAVPSIVGPWRVAATDGLVTAPSDELSAKLYDQILTRIYRAPGLPDVALLIAYGRGQDADVQLHRPDACYPAQGYVLSAEQALPIGFGSRRVPAQIVTATRDALVSQVLFWTRIGDQLPVDAVAERRLIVHENLLGRMPDASLVRMSIDTDNRSAAIATFAQFIRLLAERLPADGRSLLVDGFASGPSNQRAVARTV